MAAIVGVDAYIVYSTDGGATWAPFTERNEFSISIKVDVAEHKVFVANLASAWASKRRTWMSWSGSMQGYYDDANNTIFDRVVAGDLLRLRFYDTRYDAVIDGDNLPTGVAKYWQGDAIMTSVEHTTNPDDYSTLNVDFEGSGALTKA